MYSLISISVKITLKYEVTKERIRIKTTKIKRSNNKIQWIKQ